MNPSPVQTAEAPKRWEVVTELGKRYRSHRTGCAQYSGSTSMRYAWVVAWRLHTVRIASLYFIDMDTSCLSRAKPLMLGWPKIATT